jgi:hypothetical protein
MQSSVYIDSPFSTIIPPFSSLPFRSFQNTILNCPSLAVRVTSTSPSLSNSSMACGASFHDSFNARTGIPPPLCVWRRISVRRSALVRKLKSCYKAMSIREDCKGLWAHFIGIEVRPRIPLYAVVRLEFLQQNHVCIERSIRDNCNILQPHGIWCGLSTTQWLAISSPTQLTLRCFTAYKSCVLTLLPVPVSAGWEYTTSITTNTWLKDSNRASRTTGNKRACFWPFLFGGRRSGLRTRFRCIWLRWLRVP